jgi:hypothetical protein
MNQGKNSTLNEMAWSFSKLYASCGEHNKARMMLNMINVVVLWSIWLTTNDMCFNRSSWLGLHVIWRKEAYFLTQWSVVLQGTETENLKMKVISLEAMLMLHLFCSG